MEWNSKWDWENLDIFSSKVINSPKKLHSTEWVGEEDLDGSFNLGSGNNSSISASTESSFKEGLTVSNFSFQGFGGFPTTFSKKKEFTGTCPSLEAASVCSGEPFIGLKLGKRTYFENSFARSNTKPSPFSDVPVVPPPPSPLSVSSNTGKKVKLSSCQITPIPYCQVEGCGLDLSSAKEYHRKHRVCEGHSKCPKVVVGGLERRFCQQCSRFHGLSEFDEKKRSCRKRLSDHNARRRKPQQETIHFNSTNLSSSFYDGRQQLSFVFNNAPLVQTRPTWENSITKVKGEKDGLPQLPNAVGTRVEISDQGLKESLLGPNVDGVDIRRALSLLSNNSWDSDFVTLDHPMPPPPNDYWPADPHYIHHGYASAKTSGNAPTAHDFQVSKLPYETRFYSSPPMDEILKPF